jgi:hypothetical protein
LLTILPMFCCVFLARMPFDSLFQASAPELNMRQFLSQWKSKPASEQPQPGPAPDPAASGLKLEIVDKGAHWSKIPLDKFPAILGRSPQNDICVNDCWASRSHCELYVLDGQLMVRDLHSNNGTFINGQAITEPTRLLPNDRLTIGISSFRVIQESSDASGLSRRIFEMLGV